MFIRIKTRKNPHGKPLSYAYLAASKYRKKGPKQKTLRYLGKVHSFQREKDVSLSEYLQQDPVSFIALKPLKTSFSAILKHELENHGFSKLSEARYGHAGLLVNFVTKEVKDVSTGKPVCVALNDGFLCEYTLSKMLNFKPPEALNTEIGKNLAKRIINTGVLLKEDIFIALFQKIQKTLINH